MKEHRKTVTYGFETQGRRITVCELCSALVPDGYDCRLNHARWHLSRGEVSARPLNPSHAHENAIVLHVEALDG